jgi:hypothetical protein
MRGGKVAQQTGTLGDVQYRTVKLADLVTDGRFNRPVSSNAVNRILGNFNAQAFGTIRLWERNDGALVILDGQHRVEAARQFGVPEDAKCIPAIVHRGLTLAGAAKLFVQSNATKPVNGFDKYVALRTAGDPETLAIDATVGAHELAVSQGAADGCICCISALRYVFRLGEPEGAILGRSLKALYGAWGPLSEAYKAPIFRGVALYFHEFGEVEPDVLADALVRGPGAPINLIGWAKTIAGTQRMPLDQAIAEVIETRVMKKTRRVRSA